MNAVTKDTPAPPGVGLVQKTLQILDLFQMDAPTWSQGEIAEATGMPKSTVSRLVKFLADRGFLTLLAERNRYSLGPAAIDLGRRASALFDIRGLCRPVLEQLSFETRETVILTSVVGAGGAVRCVDQIESTREGLRVFEQIGSIFPLHAGAAPRAVLVLLDEAERDRYLSRQLAPITDRTLVDPVALRQNIALAEKTGYVVSYGETYEGVTGIGAAFSWGNGCPAGSLAIAIPTPRATPDVVKRSGELLKAACLRVNALLSADSAASQPKDGSQ